MNASVALPAPFAGHELPWATEGDGAIVDANNYVVCELPDHARAVALLQLLDIVVAGGVTS